MKCVIIVLSIFSGFTLLAQTTSSEDLSTYSYLLYGFKPIHENLINSSQGTGFFVKTETSSYFVTANHVVDGCINMRKDTAEPDVMTVWQKAQGQYKEWHLDIMTKTIRDTSICRELHLAPDLFVYSIGNQDSLKINFVSDFFYNLPIAPDELYIYGFPGANKNYMESVFEQKPTLVKSNDFTIIRSREDLVNFHINIYDKKIDSLMMGFSGSPVFLKDYNSKRIVFLGVLSSVGLTENSLYIVKAQYLFDKVNYEWKSQK